MSQDRENTSRRENDRQINLETMTAREGHRTYWQALQELEHKLLGSSCLRATLTSKQHEASGLARSIAIPLSLCVAQTLAM